MAHRPKTKRSCANSLTLSSPQMSSLSRFYFCHLQVCIVMFVTNTNTDWISVQVFFLLIASLHCDVFHKYKYRCNFCPGFIFAICKFALWCLSCHKYKYRWNLCPGFFFVICNFASCILTSDYLFIIKSRHNWCWLLDFLYSIISVSYTHLTLPTTPYV